MSLKEDIIGIGALAVLVGVCALCGKLFPENKDEISKPVVKEKSVAEHQADHIRGLYVAINADMTLTPQQKHSQRLIVTSSLRMAACGY